MLVIRVDGNTMVTIPTVEDGFFLVGGYRSGLKERALRLVCLTGCVQV